MRQFQYERIFEELKTDWGSYLLKFTDTLTSEAGVVIFSHSQDFEFADEFDLAEAKLVLRDNFLQLRQRIKDSNNMYLQDEKN